MKIPLRYTVRNFRSRKLTTGITVAGVALVVFVFAAVLMMAYGIQKTLIATGSDDNVIIARKAANGEISSIIRGDDVNIIRTLPYVARNADGSLLLSPEPVAIINLQKDDGVSNITVRGINPVISKLRPQAKIIEGRMLAFGTRELIVGSSVAKRFKGAAIGDKIRFAKDNWTIVGVFSSDGSGFDSEVWGDAIELLNGFERDNSVSTVTLKLENPKYFEAFQRALAADRRLQQYEAKVEKKFFEEQSELMAAFIRILGIFITIIFSLGATIGASITMYAAVANRTKEIGTLRALGFKRRSVLAAFLVESLILSIIGGAAGLMLASVLQFVSISTLNFGSFTELEFSFALSPQIIVTSLIFAVFMGLLGGFFPSVRASRLKIVDSLRG